MATPTILILDPVHCRADKEARELILPCLAYEDTHFKRSRYGTSQVTKKAHLITGRHGTTGAFLTGLLPRVRKYCQDNNLLVQFVGHENIEHININQRPKLKGIKFRKDQTRFLRKVARIQRGNIVATTGSGKTVIANGIFSMFRKRRILFLCHTKDLVTQTVESIHEFLPRRNVFVIGGGNKANWGQIKRKRAPIVVATIQSFSKIDPNVYSDFFDITIVDEVHHVNSKTSAYAKVMECNLSPRRYGLTATMPNKRKQVLINEGFFGPVLNELKMDDAIKQGINAKPVINLVPVKYDSHIATECGKIYKKYYQQGIVENHARNSLIVDIAMKDIKRRKVVLIIIEKTEHGKILQRLFARQGKDVPFVYGHTDKEERERVKTLLKRKRLKCAICSRVWREGTNIPALNHIINAHGMKEEKIILQAMGRGLRTAKGKTTIKLTDFLDPYKFLAEHAIRRIQIYIEQGWLNNGTN